MENNDNRKQPNQEKIVSSQQTKLLKFTAVNQENRHDKWDLYLNPAHVDSVEKTSFLESLTPVTEVSVHGKMHLVLGWAEEISSLINGSAE